MSRKHLHDMSGRILVLMLVLFFPVIAVCQERKITPVDNDDKKPRQPALHYYDRHGNQLETPVMFLSELDTVSKPRSGPVYPAFGGFSIGLNFADAVLMATGQQHHASLDIRADVSVHNWFFPVIEAGIGFADSRPENGNFHYVCPPQFFLKAGMNYNFLYKSNPDYQVFLGLRAGFSSFSYHIDDITVNSPYWQENIALKIPDQRVTAFWGEAVAGLKVKIWRHLSLGWDVRYRFRLNFSQATASSPWFVPGFGAASPLRLSFSVYYTSGAGKKAGSAE